MISDHLLAALGSNSIDRRPDGFRSCYFRCAAFEKQLLSFFYEVVVLLCLILRLLLKLIYQTYFPNDSSFFSVFVRFIPVDDEMKPLNQPMDMSIMVSKIANIKILQKVKYYEY